MELRIAQLNTRVYVSVCVSLRSKLTVLALQSKFKNFQPLLIQATIHMVIWASIGFDQNFYNLLTASIMFYWTQLNASTRNKLKD